MTGSYFIQVWTLLYYFADYKFILDIVEEATAALDADGFNVVIMIRENNAPISNEIKEKLIKDGVKFTTNFSLLD